MPTPHACDPLSADEITTATAALRATGRLAEGHWFSTITRDERPGEDPTTTPRRARALIVPGPEATLIDAVVDLASGEVLAWDELDDVRPALGFEESFKAIVALHEHDGFKDALALRGITDLQQVQIDPWPTGRFGDPQEDGRRIAKCLFYFRQQPQDNGYGRPIEGLLAIVDMARGEVLEIIDHGVVPMAPREGSSYLPEDNQPARTDLRTFDIVQPDGPSFSVDGHLIEWQRWSIHASVDPLEGLVLRDISYRDGDRTRSILKRAAISEMVVPYGDPDPSHRWKNAFDVGEWGLGRMANSLELGCDCLGEITYLDAVYADEHGTPATLTNAICLHEEDFGIVWKHQDMHTGRTEVRRQRRLVVSSIATVGNYEYAFYWYFYVDGTMALEVKLTGIMSTKGVEVGAVDPYAPAISPGLAAPVHQHLFCARLDVAVDGPVNEVHEVDVVPDPSHDEPETWGNAFVPLRTRLETERGAQREVDPARSRSWHIVNPETTNLAGRPCAYKLLPGAVPTMLAAPGSSVGRRAGFARHNLWVTPVDADQRRAAGDHPNQHAGGAGLPEFTAGDRSLVGTPIVVWHTFGVTHVPRPEDWPVMPVECTGFQLIPVAFFDRNPALDLPETTAKHCH